jgi:predicted permease
LRVLLRRSASDGEVEEETNHFLAELAAFHEARGLTPEAARRAARLEMGSSLAVRDQVRRAGWEDGVTQSMDDFRYALRRLRRSPGFAVTTTLMLALGIGATAAIFAVTDGVLLKPLPYPKADRLVALWHTAPGIHLNDLRMAPSLYYTYREEGRVFEDIALWNGNRSTVTGQGEPEEVPTLFVTAEFLRVLGVQPALGRGFAAADDDWQSTRTVVISDAYWKQKFSGSAAVLGRQLVVGGYMHEVIGVLPASFEFLDEKVTLVVPRRQRREEVRLIQFSEDGIARLKPGVSLEQANADVARCLELAPAKFPLNRGFAANTFAEARITPRLRFLKDHLVGDIRGTLWVLLGAVGILLLIACANVANLLLVRAESREQEFAVREALGAGWGRKARDLLSESLLLGAAGGVLGLGFCGVALKWLTGAGLSRLPRLASIEMDGRTVAFTVVASVAVSLIFGLVPVWKSARGGKPMALRGWGNRTLSLSREQSRTQRGLLVVQVALAMVLLIGSGLMLRTLLAMRSVEPGFSHAEEVQIVRVSIPVGEAASAEQVMRLEESILRRFSEIPTVGAVAITTAAPMEGGTNSPVYAAGRETAGGRLPEVRRTRSVSPGVMAATGSRLVAGRDFTWQEAGNGAAVALVSENMARELWGGAQAALGKRIREKLNERWSEVVGVVADLRDDGVTRNAPAIVYWPLMQRDETGGARVQRNVDYLIRSRRAGSAQFVQELQQALQAGHGGLPLANVRTLGAIYARSLERTSFALLLLAVAGAMALALGVVGIYGVVAYSVARRRKEVGIRIALGATVGTVTGMFVRQGMMLACIGAGLGLVASLGTTRLMRSLLFGVGAVDVTTYGAMLALLVLAAVVASWLPARRAAMVEPIEALRTD